MHIYSSLPLSHTDSFRRSPWTLKYRHIFLSAVAAESHIWENKIIHFSFRNRSGEDNPIQSSFLLQVRSIESSTDLDL